VDVAGGVFEQRRLRGGGFGARDRPFAIEPDGRREVAIGDLQRHARVMTGDGDLDIRQARRVRLGDTPGNQEQHERSGGAAQDGNSD